MEWYNVKNKLPIDLKNYFCLVDGKTPVVCFYTKGNEVGYEDFDYDGEYDPIEEKHGTLYLKEGWYEECEQHNGEYDSIYLKRNVTHYMLLPNLPKD